MVTRRLFGFEARQEDLVRAEGLEPSRDLRPNGFSYPSTTFAAPAVQGLGSGLSLHRARIRFRFSGAARLVSTPSPFGAWLGIAMLQGSPNLSSSASPVSRRALKFYLSPVRMPFRHARVAYIDSTLLVRLVAHSSFWFSAALR